MFAAFVITCLFFVSCVIANLIRERARRMAPIRVPDTRDYGRKVRNLQP